MVPIRTAAERLALGDPFSVVREHKPRLWEPDVLERLLLGNFANFLYVFSQLELPEPSDSPSCAECKLATQIS